MNVFKRIIVLGLCIIAAMAVVVRGDAQETTEMTVFRTLVSAEPIGSFSAAEVQATLSSIPWPSPVETEFGMDIYRLTYNTTDYNGEVAVVSALLAQPQTDTLRGVVSFQRSTFVGRGDAPSTPSETEGLLAAMVFAGAGYLHVAPDMIGGGGSTLPIRYSHAETTANVVVDLLRATHEFATERGLVWPTRLFLTGASVGGWGSMAAQRALEALNDPRFQVTASAPMTGAYNLSDVAIPFAVSNQAVKRNSVYLTLISYAYSLIYDQPLDTVLRPPYEQLAPALYDGTHTLDEIMDQLPDTVEEILQPDALRQLRAGETNWLTEALRENNVDDWLPRAPVKMYYGELDLDVGNQQAVLAAARMTALGGTVEAVSAGEVDHGTASLVAIPQIRAWFDTLAPLL
jgi:pimeloyl-ACP methyl ester carboxylesterase